MQPEPHYHLSASKLGLIGDNKIGYGNKQSSKPRGKEMEHTESPIETLLCSLCMESLASREYRINHLPASLVSVLGPEDRDNKTSPSGEAQPSINISCCVYVNHLQIYLFLKYLLKGSSVLISNSKLLGSV